jgi:hypothetical protein
MGAPTRGPHMSETDAARPRLPIRPTVSLCRICSWNQPNGPEWQQIFMAWEIVPQKYHLTFLCGCYLSYIVRLAQCIEITYTFPLVVKWFGFPRQEHVAPDPTPPFLFVILFCCFLSFCFLFARKYFMWQILSSMQKTQQQGMYTCTILKLHHLKGTISENIWIHQKFLVGGSFAPHRLFNLCNALSECFYTRVLLDSSECFYWVPERCFVIQCDLATIIFQGKYTCKHSEVAAALR